MRRRKLDEELKEKNLGIKNTEEQSFTDEAKMMEKARKSKEHRKREKSSAEQYRQIK